MDQRYEISLSGVWEFALGPGEAGAFGGETVRLPGAMDENGKGLDNSSSFSPRYLSRERVYTGPALYRRKAAIPAEWGERTTALSLTHDMGEAPLLWDEFQPNLYRMTAQVRRDGVLWDQAEEDFGMRCFTTGENQGGRQFFINGRPTVLRGEINCAIFPKTGYPPMELEAWLPPLELTGIRLAGEPALDLGERRLFALECFDAHGPCALPEGWSTAFTCSDPSVAAVDESGLVTGLRPGAAKLTAVCSNGTSRFEDVLALRVGEPRAVPISLDGAAVAASSTNPAHPIEDLFRDAPDAFWQSNYLDRTQCMPQWLQIELPKPVTANALLCGAWRGHPRGAILRAVLSVSPDGQAFEPVCRREWPESAAGDDKLFTFSPRLVRALRLDVEWSAMFTGDSNAVSVSRLALYSCPLIASARPLPVCQVRFGTQPDRALSAAALPRHLPVSLADGSVAAADVVWTWSAYHPDRPGDYPVLGTLFVPGAANPAGIHAVQVIRVKPKDMTTPPDKAALDQAYRALQDAARRAGDPSLRDRLNELLTQAESFYALTGAVQHDVDVWTDRLVQAAGEAARTPRA